MINKKDYLIIDRDKWRTGNNFHNKTGEGTTQLLNKEGYMCCLGFRCKQMGIPKKDLIHKLSPFSLKDKWDIPDLLDKNGITIFCNVAITINDSYYQNRIDREKDLIKSFATKNIIVEFKGKYKEENTKRKIQKEKYKNEN